MATTRILIKRQFPCNGYGREVVTKKPYFKANHKTCYDITTRKRITTSVRIAIKLVTPILNPLALADNGSTKLILNR
jgi:hypothetical protein